MSDELVEAAGAATVAAVTAAESEVQQDNAIADASEAAVTAQAIATDAQSGADTAASIASVATDVSIQASTDAVAATEAAQAVSTQTDQVAYATATGLETLQTQVTQLTNWRDSYLAQQNTQPEPTAVASVPVDSSADESGSDDGNRRRHRFGR